MLLVIESFDSFSTRQIALLPAVFCSTTHLHEQIFDKLGDKGRLPFTRKTRKFWLENEMVHTIPSETFRKL